MTAIATRTKLELLQAKEAELAIAVEEARARIALYPEQLHEARSRAIYAKPNVRPGAELNSEVSKLNAKERKDVEGLRTLEADLSACRGLIVTEAAKVHEEKTREARKQLELLHESERDVYQRACALFASFAEVWNELVEILETEDRFAQAAGLDSSVLVEPTPSALKAFLLLLHEASTAEDVRSEPHTEIIQDSGVYGTENGPIYDTRVLGTRTVETRRHLDDADVLYQVAPDLRKVVRALNLSGHVRRFTAE